MAVVHRVSTSLTWLGDWARTYTHNVQTLSLGCNCFITWPNPMSAHLTGVSWAACSSQVYFFVSTPLTRLSPLPRMSSPSPHLRLWNSQSILQLSSMPLIPKFPKLLTPDSEFSSTLLSLHPWPSLCGMLLCCWWSVFPLWPRVLPAGLSESHSHGWTLSLRSVYTLCNLLVGGKKEGREGWRGNEEGGTDTGSEKFLCILSNEC